MRNNEFSLARPKVAGPRRLLPAHWQAVAPPVYHPVPKVRPCVRLVVLLAPLALALALALLWVPGTRAYGSNSDNAPAGSLPVCVGQVGDSWLTCVGDTGAPPTGPPVVPWPGAGSGCTEDMPCWCAAHGLPLGNCTTADTYLGDMVYGETPAIVPPVAAQPVVTG